MVKKLSAASIFLITAIMIFSGCSRKQVATRTKQVLIPENEITETTVETQESTQVEDNQLIDFNTTNIVVSEDYTDYDYIDSEDIFTITSVETKTIQQVGITYVYIEAKGSIAGLAGTFSIDLPYSENWQINDQCSIFYKKAYDDVQNRLIITDVLYNNKVKITMKSRNERLEEERLERERLEEESRAQQAMEESLALEESKKQQEAEEKAKKAREEKARHQKITEQQAAAAKAAEQYAIQEQINKLINGEQ